jgi:hypothetical protein
VGLFDASGSGGGFAGGLGGKLFSGCLLSGGFSCGLFSACHLNLNDNF